jgi:hypothetical protein
MSNKLGAKKKREEYMQRRLAAYSRLKKVDVASLSATELDWYGKARTNVDDFDSMTLATWDGRLCLASIENIGEPDENIILCFADGKPPA